jgi:prepilin peptidase CpaA
MSGTLLNWIAVAVCSVAAFTDARNGIIPNWLTYPTLLGAPLIHAWSIGSGALLTSVAGALLCGLVPYVMFRCNGMGGGDVKLFAALGALCGSTLGLQIEVASLSLGCAWGLGLATWRGELGETLRGGARLLIGRSRAADATVEGSRAQIRLGVPIAMAAWLSLLTEACGLGSLL